MCPFIFWIGNNSKGFSCENNFIIEYIVKFKQCVDKIISKYVENKNIDEAQLKKRYQIYI